MQTIELLRWRRSVLIITNNVILHYIYCSDAWIVFQSSSLEVYCLGHEELLSDCYFYDYPCSCIVYFDCGGPKGLFSDVIIY